MKSYMLIHELNMTGVPMAALNLIRGLKAQDKSSDITLVVIGEKPKKDIPKDIKIIFLGVKRGHGLIGKVRYLFQSLYELWSFLRVVQVKSLFVWSKEFAAICKVIKPVYTTILAVNATDMRQSISTKRFSFFVGKLYSLLLRNMPMIAQSKGLAEGMREYGLKDITVIYPPLDKKFFVDNNEAPTNKMVWIGSLTDRKQPGFAISLAILLNIPIEIIGDGPLIGKLGSHPLVQFRGNQKDVLPYLKDAGVLILTSKYEGFGMVLAEAVAQGVPVVSLDCPHGPAEIIENGVNGYLAEDFDDMVAKIKIVMGRKWDKTILRESVIKFHPDKIIQEYKDIMENVFN